MTFENFGLPDNVLASLKSLNYENPTPIQEQVIPKALEGRDILGSAQTGTGKTAAFVLPMIVHLIKNPNDTALILLPTRELALQVQEAVRQMQGKAGMGSVLLIGGSSMNVQLEQLKRNPRIFVGTPGRVGDHLDRGSLNLAKARYLVLDETDRMLDMGFAKQLDRIVSKLPKPRQTLMLSATLQEDITRVAGKYLKDPVRISIGSPNVVTENVAQELIETTESLKYEVLTRQIESRTGSLLVFVRTKHGADRLAKKLNKSKFEARAIHGDLKQSQRIRAITDFRSQKCRILVATDIASRGLDIPHIENVINYDLPQSPEDYIHRVGRTARAGAKGNAVSLVTFGDKDKWKEICRMLEDRTFTGDRGYGRGVRRKDPETSKIKVLFKAV